MCGSHSHISEIRSSEGERHAERLCLAHRGVSTVLGGRFHKRKSYRITAHNELRSCGVHRFFNAFDILRKPEPVRLLNIDTGGFLINRRAESLNIR